MLWFVSLVPLGVGTTCLGTLDPLDYGHFMLNVVRHKNVYNNSHNDIAGLLIIVAMIATFLLTGVMIAKD